MVAVFVLDPGKRCKFLNAVAEVLTGETISNAIGKPFADLLWKHTPDPFADSMLGRQLQTGAGGEGEVAVIDGRGVRRPLSFRIVPVALEDDGLGATVVELVDLSGETGTGRALRESEQRLRLATEATGIGIWDINMVTGDRRWSPEFFAILGLPSDAQPSVETFLATIHPEDREQAAAQYRRAYEVPSDEPYQAEFRVRRASDGAERWISTTGRISFDAKGRPIRGIGTLRDITAEREAEQALRESEERNRLAIESNEIGTWDYDVATGRHLWSAQFKQLLGLRQDVAEDARLVRPIEGPADWSTILQGWMDSSDPQGPGRVTGEYQIRRADTGERRWCSFVGRMYYDRERKKPVRAIGIMFDVTARKAAEDRRRLELMEVHHRVRNNLAVVQAILAQTLRATRKGEDVFEVIQPRLMSMARVHDCLARSEVGEVALAALIENELDGDLPRANLSGTLVILDSASALGLGMALHELATNAHAFGSLSAPDGRVEISWSLSEGALPELEIVWQERGGPKSKSTARPGLGIRLIESSIAGLGGKAESAFKAEGARWRLAFPLPATTTPVPAR